VRNFVRVFKRSAGTPEVSLRSDPCGQAVVRPKNAARPVLRLKATRFPLSDSEIRGVARGHLRSALRSPVPRAWRVLDGAKQNRSAEIART